MKLNNTWSGRPQYYDRNADTLVEFFAAPLVPSGPIQSSSGYVVPANRLAFVSYIFLRLFRDSGANSPGPAFVVAHHTDLTLTTIQMLEVRLSSGLVNAYEWAASSPGIIMQAGESVVIQAQDGSTDGDIDCVGEINIVEFDA